MTIQFLPLAESLEAQKLGLGKSEFVWAWVNDSEQPVHRSELGEFGLTLYSLGPAYLPCEIKAGICKAVRFPDELCIQNDYDQVGRPAVVYASIRYYVGDSGFVRKSKATTDITECLALFALYKKIKEAVCTN